MIAYLGTGLLGANFTKALLAKGETVHVWNRTVAKAKALEADGAKSFESAAEAVKGATRIHITLSDDSVVDSVLDQASAGFEPGAIILDHTTTSVEGAIRRTKAWADRGITYVHAPVFMGPSNALDSSGFMLISDKQEIVDKVSPWLSPMTGKLLNFGEQTGKAAGIKLIGNLFLLTLTAGFSDMLALAKAMGLAGQDIATLFESFNPGAAAPGRLKRVMSADYDNPSWELQMARKDARLMMEEAEKGNKSLILVPSIAKEMDRFLEKGFAHKDWSVIAADNL
ncbi:NAD(P)-dependent oxidoreductase [Flavihumibacter stibioxidans]|uniref:6-phosphogluconate dehydrogenase n=1 Tax=Flavihumibacter stibioxidans TaxID=1834163 RepID=A0ABR7M828_9BACT|nr:NAD(P)-dependent oxidoreductase [Flavihumibacter stibioxidans]MBC6491195.1 6-phosphogluconate dehydrogenase [Flavihumibacter stibioxidans]